ncbi:PLS1-like protein, partial [Mya arenaria]
MLLLVVPMTISGFVRLNSTRQIGEKKIENFGEIEAADPWQKDVSCRVEQSSVSNAAQSESLLADVPQTCKEPPSPCVSGVAEELPAGGYSNLLSTDTTIRPCQWRTVILIRIGLPSGAPANVPWMPKPNVVGCPAGLEYLADLDKILVQKQIDLTELLTMYDAENRYRLFNPAGQQVTSATDDQDIGEITKKVTSATDDQDIGEITKNIYLPILPMVNALTTADKFGVS